MRVVTASLDGSSTATRLWLISVVMAKPNSMICSTGMPNRISIVRRSRKMWKNSILTKAQNSFIVHSPLRVASRASRWNTPSMSFSPNVRFSPSGVSNARMRPSTMMETRLQNSASSM